MISFIIRNMHKINVYNLSSVTAKECEGDMVYRTTQPSCHRTCENVHHELPDMCFNMLQNWCTCPPGTFLQACHFLCYGINQNALIHIFIHKCKYQYLRNLCTNTKYTAKQNRHINLIQQQR